jgi:hypothetical protein
MGLAPADLQMQDFACHNPVNRLESQATKIGAHTNSFHLWGVLKCDAQPWRRTQGLIYMAVIHDVVGAQGRHYRKRP